MQILERVTEVSCWLCRCPAKWLSHQHVCFLAGICLTIVVPTAAIAAADRTITRTTFAQVATLFDTDGISIRAMNHPSMGDGIRTSAQAAQYVAGLKFSGM